MNVKPIAEDGSYQGNDVALNAFVGSNNQQKYNITGAELFLGEERQVKRTITSNVIHSNLLANYSALQTNQKDTEPLSTSSTIRNLMGDTDNTVDPTDKHFFYLRGTQNMEKYHLRI